MTLDEAVEILNNRQHNNSSGWENLYGELAMCIKEPFHCALTRFEAIAVAEKYKRQAAARR